MIILVVMNYFLGDAERAMFAGQSLQTDWGVGGGGGSLGVDKSGLGQKRLPLRNLTANKKRNVHVGGERATQSTGEGVQWPTLHDRVV